MSDPISGTVQALELAGRAGYFIWQATRTTLDVHIDNRHPHIKLQNFARYCHTGRCTEPQAFRVLPQESRSFQFIADTLGLRIDGCCVYGITPYNRPATTINRIYLLLAWSIQLNGECKTTLNLVETYKGQDLTGSLLQHHYISKIVPSFESSENMLTRSWDLIDPDTRFTVNLSLNNAASGVMKVEIIHDGEKSSIDRPHFVGLDYFKDVIFKDTDELEGLDASKDRFGLTSSISVHIDNNCESLALIHCETYSISGKLKENENRAIYYGAQSRHRFKNGTPLGRTSGVLVYELIHDAENAPAILWGYRVFLAVDFLVTSHNAVARTVSITLLAVRDVRFPNSDRDPLLRAHEKVLSHHMVTFGKSSVWDLHDLNLKIWADFKRSPHAKLYLRLEKARFRNHHAIPLFLPTNENSQVSSGARNAIKQYITSNTEADGINVVEIADDLKVKLQYITPSHAGRGTLVKCQCNNQTLSSGSWCITRKNVPEKNWSMEHYYLITPTFSATRSPYQCVLYVRRDHVSFTVAPVFILRDDSIGEELKDDVDNFLNQSYLVGEHMASAGNSYDHGRIMERRVQLPGNVNFQLLAYMNSQPCRLFKLLLKREFIPEEFHREARINSEQPFMATPYTYVVILDNKHTDMKLKLASYFSTGIPNNIQRDEVLPPGETKTITFTLFANDLRHGIALTYRTGGNNPITVEIQANMSVENTSLLHSTAISYKTANDKKIKIGGKNRFRVETLQERFNEDEELQNTFAVESKRVEADGMQHYVAIGHTGMHSMPRTSYVAIQFNNNNINNDEDDEEDELATKQACTDLLNSVMATE
ncbi:hypothetical protein BDF22DRAFT_690085 [Syncephalis plumigaleata]|nr:hypothetical protein BDF22DRAFT_690085 [Syncephalis plumigaleata]